MAIGMHLLQWSGIHAILCNISGVLCAFVQYVYTAGVLCRRMDCTLKELSSLVREVNPDLREKGTVLSFATVYPDRRGLFKVKEIGTTVCGRKGNDDIKTLRSQKFQIGDFMSVAVSRRASRGRPY